MSIGTNISELRRSKGLTQQQLAEKLGVSGQSVSKWENDVCAPDVGQFPLLAAFFGVSIDRLYGFHLTSGEEARELIERADRCESLEENIAMLKTGLGEYPNSPELKTALAMSWLSAWRTGLGGVGKDAAREECLRLCREVVRTCGDRQQVDYALEIMSRAYGESGEYEPALECLEKLSAEAYGLRLVGKASVLQQRGDHVSLARFGEKEIFSLWNTMEHLLAAMTAACAAQGEPERALAFAEAREQMLSLFDAGCPGFFAARRLWAAEAVAAQHMTLCDRAGCLEALGRFMAFAEESRAAAEAESHEISRRNPLFFHHMRNESEVWTTGLPTALILRKYAAFFGDAEDFRELMKEAEKSGKDA